MARLLLSYGADANIRDEVRHFRILIKNNVSVPFLITPVSVNSNAIELRRFLCVKLS